MRPIQARQRLRPGRPGLALVLLLALAAAARADSAPGELVGYRLWLHSLEQTASARARAEAAEQVPLYPFDRTGRAKAGNQAVGQRASIVASAAALERAARARAIDPGREAFAALARARNRVNLCRFDSALVWYREAADLDTTGALRDEIAREALAAALAAGDTAAARRAVDRTLASTRLAGREGEVVLAYRCLLALGDTAAVDALAARVAAEPDLEDGRLLYWHASALAWRGRSDESLQALQRLLNRGGLSHGLSEAERTWVLTAVPDLLVLVGDEAGASVLYRMLAASALPDARIWGAYRQAGLDLAAGRYVTAQLGYARVCAEKRDGPWRQRACQLEAIAGRLAGLQEKGEAYGVAYDAR